MDRTASAPPDQLGNARECQPAPPQIASTALPVNEVPAEIPSTPLAEMPAAELNLTGPLHSALADLNPTEAESTEMGHPRCQPAKHKLDACLALQFKAAEEKEAREWEKLQAWKRKGVAPPTKCQHTK